MNRKIQKLRREIAEIEDAFYGATDGDPENVYFFLKLKRDHALRGIILELHLSLEDLIAHAIRNKLLAGFSVRTPRTHSMHELLEGERSIGFKNKLELARSIGLLSPTEYRSLSKLNAIRNRCSHNWGLNQFIRRKIRPAKKKRPLLEYEGRNLYKVDVYRDFIAHYGPLYARLWMKFNR